VGVAREAEDVGHGVPVAADRINDVCISVDGVLILERTSRDERKQAMRILREEAGAAPLGVAS